MAVLGLGGTTFGREIGEDDSFRILDRAYELGFRTVDTAESYGGGNSREYRRRVFGIDDRREASDVMHSSELILGKWLRSRAVEREIAVHTKTLGDQPPEAIRDALLRSLERLQLESVDGFYLHSPPSDVETAVAALAEVRESGLTRRIGICNAEVDLLTRACAVATLDLCQNVLNVALRDGARTVVPWCEAHGVAFVAYSPLGAGFLTGKYGARGELAPKGTRFDVVPGHRDVYFRPECFTALDRLAACAVETGIPQHLLALYWAMRHAGVSILLVGATRLEHLENAVSAASLKVPEGCVSRLEADGASA